MQLRLVFDYSLHDEIVHPVLGPDAASQLALEAFYRALQDLDATALSAGPVDLLIRTGHSGNFSDFLLWETACAQLLATGREWPDFTQAGFGQILDDYRKRRSYDGVASGERAANAQEFGATGIDQVIAKRRG
jgi:undecaprenyl diphosphate synthase